MEMNEEVLESEKEITRIAESQGIMCWNVLIKKVIMIQKKKRKKTRARKPDRRKKTRL